MKKCENCGFENPDGFTFCGFCGKRTDGKIECEKCGKLISKNTKYCGFCGSRVDGKIECSNCHTVREKNIKFCPNCGQQELNESAKKKTGQKNIKSSSSKVLIYDLFVKISAIVLSVLFIIGILCPYLSMEANGTTSTSLYLFDFLSSDFFDSFKTLTSTFGKKGELMGIYLALGFTFAVVGTISTVTFGIITIVKNSMSLYNKEKCDSYKFLRITIFSYFCMIGAVLLLNGGLINTQGTSISLGAMPIILLILTIMVVIVKNIIGAFSNGFEVSKANIMSLSFKLVSFIFSIVAFFLILGPVVVMKNSFSSTHYLLSVVSITTDINAGASVFAVIVTLIVVISMIGSLCAKATNFIENKKKLFLTSSIVEVSSVVISFIVSLVVFDKIMNYASLSVAPGFIIALIFALISLGTSITSIIFNKKQ